MTPPPNAGPLAHARRGGSTAAISRGGGRTGRGKRVRSPVGHLTLSPRACRLARLQAQGLLSPPTSSSSGPLAAVAVARTLFGVQAQEVASAALAVWHRTRGADGTPTTTRVALMGWLGHPGEGPPSGLVRLHGQRGTLHAYDAEDWPAVAGAYADRLSAARSGTLTAGEKKKIVEQQGVLATALGRGADVSNLDIGGGRTYTAFMGVPLAGAGARANVTGRTVLAPRAVLAPNLPAVWAPPPTSSAVATAVRRYFGAFAPATEPDVRYYLGLLACESRAAVAALLAEGTLISVLVSREASEALVAGSADVDPDGAAADAALAVGPSYMLASVVAPRAAPASTASLPCRLLGRFDPLVLGHPDKAWLVPPAYKARVWTRNAQVHAVCLLGGRAIGTWAMAVGGAGVAVVVSTWGGGGVTAAVAATIRAEAGALAEGFWELPLTGCAID